jgi:hypothetical protein
MVSLRSVFHTLQTISFNKCSAMEGTGSYPVWSFCTFHYTARFSAEHAWEWTDAGDSDRLSFWFSVSSVRGRD